MLSLIVALLSFAWQYFISKVALTTAYLSATHLLFVLYIIGTILWIVLAVVISVVVYFGLTDKVGVFGGLLSMGVTGLLLVLLLIRQALLVGGAYLLSTAFSGEWDYVRLGFGALLIFVGLISGGKSSSSKSD